MTPERLKQIEELYHSAREDRAALDRADPELRREVESLLAQDPLPELVLPSAIAQVESLFHAALERPAGKRESWLRKACGDNPSLFREAAALLAHHELGAFGGWRRGGAELSAGTRLGAYEILAQIGVGGMGEVYRARDTRLKRDVAIKVLPEPFARDLERMARFQREAEVLASLNHPNIAHIYGVEERALVMEMVEGESPKGPMPFEEAWRIASQIAAALEYAHDKGVIHRDLKPANVKVTPDGMVKLLDFGLAKAMAVEREAAAAAVGENSPTLTISGTVPGVVLGSAAYMAPEQAKGARVDRRADIWAFGVVLYELLTGKRLFKGEDVSDSLAAVLTKQPHWDDVPAQARVLLRACLEKEPKNRLRDIADARRLLVEAPELKTSPLWSRLGWAAAAAVLAVALAGLAFVHFREKPPDAPPETRPDIVTPFTSDPASFALSPDGRQIVFAAAGDGPQRLWLRRLDTTSEQPLADTEGASYPFWSPDNRSIGFFADNKLKRLDLGAGVPQTLCDAANRGGAWGPDGTILFARSPVGPLFRISASNGEPVAVTKLLEKQTTHRFPQFLPGGRQFVFYVEGSSEAAGIYLGSLDSPQTKRLTSADTTGTNMPNGWLLFVRTGTLVAQRLDLSRGQLTGDMVTAADAVAVDPLNAGAFSVSTAGLIAYRPLGSSQHQLVWFDRSGNALGNLGDPNPSILAPRLSHDGRTVAFSQGKLSNQEIQLLDAARSTRFTFEMALDRYPVWSPNSDRIVFGSNRKGPWDLYIAPTNQPGSEQPLLESPEAKIPTDWSKDGRFLFYYSIDPQTSRDLWVLRMEDRKKFLVLNSNYSETWGQFSPDGQWVAYMSDRTGKYEIYVRPFSEASPGASTGSQQPGWKVSESGGIYPRWRGDSKELYYIAPDRELMAVPITAKGAILDPGTPVALFQTQILFSGADPGLGPQYDVDPHGRFLINTLLNQVSPITLIQNWKPSEK